MKPVIASILFAAALAGCQADPQADQRVEFNSRLVEAFSSHAIQNAIVTQHTLFPYHFITDTAELNELGRRDMGVLTAHYRLQGGELSIRRGDATAGLYESRVKAIRDTLIRDGIKAEKVHLSDGPAGGDGTSSERVVMVLNRADLGRPGMVSYQGTDVNSATSVSPGGRP